MFLGKNFLGLFFLFLSSAGFSQKEQFEKINDANSEYAFIEINEALYIGETNRVGESAILFEKLENNFETDEDERNSDMLIEESKSNVLLSSITSKIVDKKYKRFVLYVLNINSKYSDYAPSFYRNELVFASSRDVNKISKTFDAINNQPFLDLYAVKKKVEKQRVKKLKGNINSKFHESSATFSVDRETVYFTRNNYSKKKPGFNKRGSVLLKIYRATFDGDKWGNIVELPFNGDEYSIAHPALSADGKFLYFASDMPGSIGQSDLYVVEINDDGTFGVPRNLGNRINTPGRETFPYISDNGKLFFASDGHKGMGGLDVFMMMPDKKGVMGAYNLGEPINSPDDDFTFIINEKSKVGYFASNRKGGKGDDDIYGFRQTTSFPKYRPSHKPNVKWQLKRYIDLKPNKDGTTSL